MCIYVEVLGKMIPSYGLTIILGVITANLAALRIIHKNKLDVNDYMILEAYCFLGAFIGAKLLYLIVSFHEIEWERIVEAEYFNQLMQGGFVFYGGLIGGLLLVILAGKLHHIDAVRYMRFFIFLIPFIHCFGRIGCFLSGCCYGIPYHGPGAVVFPEGGLAPAGIYLFPVQLVEALLLLLITLLSGYLSIKNKTKYSIELYFISYGIVRFILEYFRYDDIRGIYGSFSTSQWISILMILLSVTSFLYGKRKQRIQL